MGFVFGFALVLVALAAIALRPKASISSTSFEHFDIYALSARYRPMLRLLDGSDFQLLNHAGDPKLARRMRSQRRTIFRGYLRSLRRDHARLCAKVRELIIHSATDQRELAISLFRMEMNFQVLLFTVNCRLAMHAVGLGNVAVWNLMNAFEQVRSHAESLAAPAAA
jgi:hypothetical protein